MKLSYLDLNTVDPAFNLAAEQYVFDSLPRDRAYCMLWQNDNAVIIGKYQNTYAEINEAFVREHGIRVVRRLSGGGAVYHDLGNLNFSFIADVGELSELNFRLFCEPVVRTLSDFGVTAEINGRNDITIDGKKFSGNSQYVKQGRVLHHGTILFNSDLSIVSNALRADESKFRSKASKSIRSRVTNVADHLDHRISLQVFRAALLSEIIRSAESRPYFFSAEEIEVIDSLRTARYDTWSWNYGSSPACTYHRRARVEGCGTVEVNMSVAEGIITDVVFSGDFFSIDGPDALASRFIGLSPDEGSFQKALGDTDISRFIVGLDRDALLKILCS